MICSFFISSEIFATAYVKLTANNKVDIQASLSDLFEHTKIPKIKVVQPEGAENLPISSLPKVEMMYKTDFYNYLNNNLNTKSSSVFFIMNRAGSIVYESPIEEIDYDQVNYFTRYDYSTLIGSEIFRLDQVQYFNFQNEMSVVVSSKNKTFIANMAADGLAPLKVDEGLRADMYKEFLKEDFEKRYEDLISYLEGHNSKGYGAREAYFVNDNEVIVIYRISDWERKTMILLAVITFWLNIF